MAQIPESLDFSGLFKLDSLVNFQIKSYSFYEVGLEKFMAFSSGHDLLFYFISQQSERLDKQYDWDFVDNPVYSMCFEPTGTWLTIVSDQKVLLVPFLPIFCPQSCFDHKWSLSRVTVLALGIIPEPSSVVWWLTKNSDNILIIGSKTGHITFYCLQSQAIVGETKVFGEIVDLQICFDDSLDLLTLLISGGTSQQWKLVLEHRSFGYNWLQQNKSQVDRDKKESFMSYIRQFSKDKITFFIQGGSKDGNKSQTVEHSLKPTEYLPMFRKGSNNWALTAQYVNGRHFLTAFELNEGTLILESPDEDTPSRTLRPQIKKDVPYLQGLWTQRLLYLVKKNGLEIHSANFSVIQGEAILGTKREYTELWSMEVPGEVRRAHIMSCKEPTTSGGGWKEPTFMCDLQLPRFNLDPCLLITDNGAYVLNTVCEPCEWLVGMIMRGGVGAEQSACALGASVPTLLRCAADMLLSRGKLSPAQYLYSLSQCPPDGWVARLGVFGKLKELVEYKPNATLGNTALVVRLLAILLQAGCAENNVDVSRMNCTSLTTSELTELASVSASIGLWDLVPTFSIHRGHPEIMLAALKSKNNICRGGLVSLLRQKCLVPLLLENETNLVEDTSRCDTWLFDFIDQKCDQFDLDILKNLCLWLNPLQDQLRPVLRDMRKNIKTTYTKNMLRLISTFMRVACAIESRDPRSEIVTDKLEQPHTWRHQFVPRRMLSCGLSHWAVTNEGNAKIMNAYTPIKTELIGRVISVACGRHHTLVLTENGIYSSGDNTYGQLGIGSQWPGAIGDAASANGTLLHVAYEWNAPILMVAAGHYHSAAVDAGGRLYVWGWGVHGQLGLGSIEDQVTPQLVTRFQGRKVLSVGCGSCHSAVLMKNGEVWCMGASVFGQLGTGSREKSSVPVRVHLTDPVQTIAVGYFHNLALTTKGEVWSWGSSPQQIRATNARLSNSPTPQEATSDPHLLPTVLDTSNVKWNIVQLSAGWHHSCILDNGGTLYAWGLNFNGQLGTGDRKLAHIPIEVKIRNDAQPEKSAESKEAEVEVKGGRTRAMVACGGDFTVYMDDDEKIYVTGNMNVQAPQEKGNRVIMMKTTKRVIKIPTKRSNNMFMFQPTDRIDIMFPFDIDDLQRSSIESINNPINTIQDFQKKTWADDVILQLKPWIKNEDLNKNLNMSAKWADHNKNHAECLKLLLKNLKQIPPLDKIYLMHSNLENLESKINANDRAILSNVISKRIKNISLSLLNEDKYPSIDSSIFKTLPCCCDETKYVQKHPQPLTNIVEKDLSASAAKIIDKCMEEFPIDNDLWEICFRHCKDFFLENNLSMDELETILNKYMKSNPTAMISAVLYSNDCAQYNKVFSPKFYLNMCSEVLDTWG